VTKMSVDVLPCYKVSYWEAIVAGWHVKCGMEGNTAVDCRGAVFTAVLTIQSFWNVWPSWLVNSYRRFQEGNTSILVNLKSAEEETSIALCPESFGRLSAASLQFLVLLILVQPTQI
jgi:hypothetical protein